MYRHGPLFIMAFGFIAVGLLACVGIIASDIYNGGSEGWIILGILGSPFAYYGIKDMLEQRRLRDGRAYWAKRAQDERTH